MTASSFTAPEPKAPRKRKPKAVPAAAAVPEVAPAPAPQPVAQPVPAPQPKAQRRSRGINLAPKAEAKACRYGTKQAILVDLLFRSGGASMAELREALAPWKDITIKSGLVWARLIQSHLGRQNLRPVLRRSRVDGVHAAPKSSHCSHLVGAHITQTVAKIDHGRKSQLVR